MSERLDERVSIASPDLAGVPLLSGLPPNNEFAGRYSFLNPSLLKRIPWIETVVQNEPRTNELDPGQPRRFGQSGQPGQSLQPGQSELQRCDAGQFEPNPNSGSLCISGIEIDDDVDGQTSSADAPSYEALNVMDDRAEDVSEKLPALIHDMRNMVATIDLYCDLLQMPNVLNARFRHYAEELRMVGRSSQRLLRKMAFLESYSQPPASLPKKVADRRSPMALEEISAVESAFRESAPEMGSPECRSVADSSRPGKLLSLVPKRVGAALQALVPIKNGPANMVVAEISSERGECNAALHPGTESSAASSSLSSSSFERRQTSFPRACGRQLEAADSIAALGDALRSNYPLISALAGPGVTVGLSIKGANGPVSLTREDLTRILVNLTRNAVQAMHSVGHIQIDLAGLTGPGVDRALLSFADDGVGIEADALEAVFAAGYTTQVLVEESSSSEDGFEIQGRSYPPKGLQSQRQDRGPSDTQSRSGRGLGLSIVRSIVTRAGGRIWARNRHPLLFGQQNCHETTGFAEYAAGNSTQGIAQDPSVCVLRSRLTGSPLAPSSISCKGAIIAIDLPITSDNSRAAEEPEDK